MGGINRSDSGFACLIGFGLEFDESRLVRLDRAVQVDNNESCFPNAPFSRLTMTGWLANVWLLSDLPNHASVGRGLVRPAGTCSSVVTLARLDQNTGGVTRGNEQPATWMCDVDARDGVVPLLDFANRAMVKRLRTKSQIVSFA
jgi:hypothetical protein